MGTGLETDSRRKPPGDPERSDSSSASASSTDMASLPRRRWRSRRPPAPPPQKPPLFMTRGVDAPGLLHAPGVCAAASGGASEDSLRRLRRRGSDDSPLPELWAPAPVNPHVAAAACEWIMLTAPMNVEE